MFRDLLEREFSPYGQLSASQLDQLESHYKLLLKWNESLNLTRLVDASAAVKFHYCESLYVARFLPDVPQRVVDVGSGGGFPGVPIAIFRPEWEVTLVESHQRKAVFLREASRELRNVRVVASRAQEMQGTFDWLVSRAVAPAEVLSLELAPDVVLLIGEQDAVHLAGEKDVVPWGRHRVLFHVKRSKPNVSRETSQHAKIERCGQDNRNYEPKRRRR